MPTTRTAGTPFVQSREVLMVMMASPKGFYFDETEGFFGEIVSTPRDALYNEDRALFCDDTTKYIRFDLDAMHGVDVTEEVAAAWLDDFGGRPSDEGLLPDFVRLSDTWLSWCESYYTTNGILSRNQPRTYNLINGRVA